MSDRCAEHRKGSDSSSIIANPESETVSQPVIVSKPETMVKLLSTHGARGLVREVLRKAAAVNTAAKAYKERIFEHYLDYDTFDYISCDSDVDFNLSAREYRIIIIRNALYDAWMMYERGEELEEHLTPR